MKSHLLYFFCFFLIISCTVNNKQKCERVKTPSLKTCFIQGFPWNDREQNPINAHNGSILYHEGTYYWYGEAHTAPSFLPFQINCYSSKDLLNWNFENIVFPSLTDKAIFPQKTVILSHPIVIYNKETQKFVLWVKTIESNPKICIALSTHPNQRFQTANIIKDDKKETPFTLFLDHNDKAYYISSLKSEIRLYPLTKDYLNIQNQYHHLPSLFQGTISLFKNGLKYHLILSNNQKTAQLLSADSIHGTWTTSGNPYTGPDAEKNFHAQLSFILPVQGKSHAFIAIFDNKKDSIAEKATPYIWLPIIFNGESPIIPWYDTWDTTIFHENNIQ